MPKPASAEIADTILAAPAWVRLGLVDRDARLQQRAADALAARIALTLADKARPDPRQLVLPMSG